MALTAALVHDLHLTEVEGVRLNNLSFAQMDERLGPGRGQAGIEIERER